MNSLILFFSVCIVSALGSLQLGLVNSEVIFTSLSKSYKKARLVAVGGILPEFIYAFLAVYFAKYLQLLNMFHHDSLTIFSSLILIFVAVLLFLNHQKNIDADEILKIHEKIKFLNFPKIRNSHISRGFILGIINIQLLVFWFFISLSFSSIFDFQNIFNKISFILGAGIGAFIILIIIAKFVDKFKTIILNKIRIEKIYRITGIFLIILATFQIWRIL